MVEPGTAGALRNAAVTSSFVTSLRHSGGIRNVGTRVDEWGRVNFDASLIDLIGDVFVPCDRFNGSGVKVFLNGVPKKTSAGVGCFDLPLIADLGVSFTEDTSFCAVGVPICFKGEAGRAFDGVRLVGLARLDGTSSLSLISFVGLGVLVRGVIVRDVPVLFGVTLLIGSSHEK